MVMTASTETFAAKSAPREAGRASMNSMWIIWTPDRIADEIQHGAPLDILQVHVLHVVGEDDGVWLHSHGLAEMGFLDFDVLRPAQALTEDQFDVLRAIAFQMVEDGDSGEIWPVMGADPLSLIDAATFMRSASPADRALRDPENHSDRRVICCDPKPPGFLSRLFGAVEIRPSRLLSRGMVEGAPKDLSTAVSATSKASQFSSRG
jgi:hypothetical protein